MSKNQSKLNAAGVNKNPSRAGNWFVHVVGVLSLLAAASAAAGPASQSQPASSADAGVFIRESFDDGDLPKRGWYDGEKYRISSDAKVGKGCIEFAWADGGTTPVGSHIARHLIEPTDEVYIRFYVRLSKGWDWSGKGFHPHLMHVMTTENDKWMGPAATHLTLYVEPMDGKLRLAAQDIQNKDSPHGLTQGPLKGGYNGKMYDSKDKLFTDDKWHLVEAYFKLNTLDMKNDKPVADGVVRGWFDGKLVIDHADVVLRSTDFPKMKFNQYMLAPYFGPGLLPHAQTLWLDELLVAKRRPEAATAAATNPSSVK